MSYKYSYYQRFNNNFRKKADERVYREFQNWRRERFRRAQQKGFLGFFFRSGPRYCPTCGKRISR
ncbi:MAG: hypothetical protein LBE13_02110 [Bacteroidales bacterium]|jgi:hypothetical protein|nr:hypothetical protein [Bacteroidales bacterium]